MALKDTCARLEKLLEHVLKDLHKAKKGNKAACQRCRTGTIQLAKVAKAFRKESVAEGKKGKGKKKKATRKKTARKKTARKKTTHKKTTRKKATRRKTTHKKATRKTARRKTRRKSRR